MRVHLSADPKELAQRGPTIDVWLGIDGKNIPGLSDDMERVQLPALIDTGATGNAIDGLLAASLKLPIVGTSSVSGVRGEHSHVVHLAQVYVPSLDATIYGRFVAVELLNGRQPHAVLLGRTFLENYSMIYVGQTGEVILDDSIVVV